MSCTRLCHLARWEVGRLESERHACPDTALILRKHNRARVRNIRSIAFCKKIAYVQQCFYIQAAIMIRDWLPKMQIQVWLHCSDRVWSDCGHRIGRLPSVA